MPNTIGFIFFVSRWFGAIVRYNSVTRVLSKWHTFYWTNQNYDRNVKRAKKRDTSTESLQLTTPFIVFGCICSSQRYSGSSVRFCRAVTIVWHELTVSNAKITILFLVSIGFSVQLYNSNYFVSIVPVGWEHSQMVCLFSIFFSIMPFSPVPFQWINHWNQRRVNAAQAATATIKQSPC